MDRSGPLFVGEVHLRRMAKNKGCFRLLTDVFFIDKDDRRWRARQGLLTDGASIPRWAWPIIGSPFNGLYVRAAVLHDQYCVNHAASWEDTHKMFYEAMLLDGVPKWKAKLMYWCVYHFGPRWYIIEADT